MNRCWAFTLAFNEATLIRYWAAHYLAFCERVVVYVDTSTDDGTQQLAKRCGAEVRPYDRGGTLDDMAFVSFAQEHYQEARGQAEWVIWVDADEILWHPRGMKRRLAELRREHVTLPVVRGYQMVAEAPPSGPQPIWRQITRGVPAPEYDKPCVFDPALDVQWTPGKHTAYWPGTPPVQDDGADPLRLLHYRYLGEQWLRERNARNFARIPDGQRRAGLGREVYPDWTGRYSPEWFRGQMPNVQEVVRA